MATTIDLRDLPDRFRELIAEASAGAEVIVTDEGTPRALLVPLTNPPAKTAGLHPGAIQAAEDFDEPLPEEFWARGSDSKLL